MNPTPPVIHPPARQAPVLLVSVFIIAICGLIYELVVGTLSSYLFGNSVAHFSVTIGLFMSAMGVGAYVSRRITNNLLVWFVAVEMGVGLAGGVSAALLYAVFATSAYYHVAMVVLILVIGTLIGMEIPLVTRILGGWQALKDTLSNVLAFDYLGALIASVLFPLVLLPQLGLLNTAFATGLLNVAVVGVVLYAFRQHLLPLRRLAMLNTALAVGLLAGVLWSNPLTTYFEKKLYVDDIIYTQQTPYQRIVMTRWGSDIRLFLDGALQFSAQDEYRYHEPLVHPAMTLSRSRETVLILGGGDGLAAREVLKYDDVQRLVLVDLDPAMTQLGQSYPPLLQLNERALLDPRVEIVNEDAFSYLAESSELFSVILIDLPDPNNESLGKLYSTSFYTIVRRHLARGGIVASQATSPYFARKAYWSIIHTAAASGLKPYPYHTYIPSFGDWGFFLAAEHDLDVTTYAPRLPMRYLTPALFQVSFLFDNDIAEVETDINTLDNQIILAYYDQGWKRWN